MLRKPRVRVLAASPSRAKARGSFLASSCTAKAVSFHSAAIRNGFFHNLLILLSMIAVCANVFGQDSDSSVPPSLVEVYWQSSKTVVAPGITNIIILDQDIARAETGADTVRFFGLKRGETVALGYMGNLSVSIRIRVVQRPLVMVPPSLLRRQEEMAQGSASSTVETSNSGGAPTVAVLNGFSWSQLMGNGHFDFSSQVEDDSYAGGHAFNLRTASAVFHNSAVDIHALDFNANLVGTGPQSYLSPFSFGDFIELRGADVTLKHEKNEYDFFGGVTVPFFYLTLGSTRDVAGFTFRRRQTEKLVFFATTSFLNTPVDFLGTAGARRNNYMQTAGFSYKLSPQWAMQAAGGASNHGGMVRGEFSYTGDRITAFGAGIMSSVMFPTNQLGSLLTGTSSVKGGLSFRHREWLTESFIYQHVVTQAVAGITTAGSSDYLIPAVWTRVGEKHDLNFSYTYSHNQGGFSNQSSTGNRFDTLWHYQFIPQASNTAQFTYGSLQDPLQLNSEDQYMLRDSVFFPVKGGSMTVAVEHDQTNPSLVQKLNSELSLLTPALQSLFLSDPVSFVNSTNLPPEIRALLDAQQPVSTSISASGQFHVGNKLTMGPSFSFAKISGLTTQSWAPFFGYGLNYRVTPTFQLTSGLTNTWVVTNAGGAQRTTLLSFGFTKNFRAMPASFMPRLHGRAVEGRVFRDTDMNGFFNAGEQGLAGIRVQLDDDQIAVTDQRGRYKFSDVSSGQHRVFLSLPQFGQPIRMTTKNEAHIDLIRERVALVDFGIVDFARLMGNIFNDLRLDGKRQPDSKGLPEVHLTLDDGQRRRTITAQGTGEYEVDDVPPGDYMLTVDRETLPPDYALATDTFPVHISPVSTVVQDVPVQALRSIGGRLLLKTVANSSGGASHTEKLKIGGVPAGSARSQRGQKSRAQEQGAGATTANEYSLVPLAGVQLTAGSKVVKTDENGNFLLRDLPAGDLTVAIVVLKPLPTGMTTPSGAVRLPAEPIQVQGATIIINNPDLLPYLVDAPAKPTGTESH